MNYINELYEKFINDPSFVYKSCKKDWIVIMQKLPDTITNEKRLNDNIYAKYRADKLLVHTIFNKWNPNDTQLDIENSIYKKQTITYIIGDIVKSNNYDMNIKHVCTSGIHYFKNIECAFYCELEEEILINCNYSGFIKSWGDDGNLKELTDYENGKIKKIVKYNNYFRDEINEKIIIYENEHKKCKENIYHNNEIKKTINYIDDKKNGVEINYFSFDKIQSLYQWMNNKLHGEYKEFYRSGKLKSEGLYYEYNKDGIWTTFYENGDVYSNEFYNKGNKIGIWKKWNNDGNLIFEADYSNIKYIIKEWYDNKQLKSIEYGPSNDDKNIFYQSWRSDGSKINEGYFIIASGIFTFNKCKVKHGLWTEFDQYSNKINVKKHINGLLGEIIFIKHN